MADSLLRADQIKALSAEGRVKNSYEALYYKVKSGDPELDEQLRAEIQRAFEQHNVTLADNPDKETLRDIMLDAYKETAKSVSGVELQDEQVERLSRDFDRFTENHPKFYESSFQSYENKYGGEPVDFAADYSRMVQENDGVDPRELDMTEGRLDAMAEAYEKEQQEKRRKALAELRQNEQELNQSSANLSNQSLGATPESLNQQLELTTPQETIALHTGEPGQEPLTQQTLAMKHGAAPALASGLSYAAHVPEAAQTTRRSYRQVKQEEAAAEEMKGQAYDKEYDTYARNRKDSYQKTTAGDSYGFDEHDNEYEDEGPEL